VVSLVSIHDHRTTEERERERERLCVWLVFVSTVMLIRAVVPSSSEVKSVSNSMGSPFLSHGSPSQHESTQSPDRLCSKR